MFLARSLKHTALWAIGCSSTPALDVVDSEVTEWTKEQILLELGNQMLGWHIGSTLSMEQRVAGMLILIIRF